MPDFSSLYTADECVMLEDAYNAISQCELWDWMATFNPHANEGFMFSTHPNLERISSAMKYAGHSGASWAWTLRNMQAIAKVGGWDAYKQLMTERWPASRPVCSCRVKRGITLGWCGVASGGVPACEY